MKPKPEEINISKMKQEDGPLSHPKSVANHGVEATKTDQTSTYCKREQKGCKPWWLKPQHHKHKFSKKETKGTSIPSS